MCLRFTPRCIHWAIPLFMPPPVGKGAICVAFVRPSVCPSVCPFRPSIAYIANNSRGQCAQISKEGSPPWCESHFCFKIKKFKRWKVKVTRPINGPGDLDLSPISCATSTERRGLWTSNLVHGYRTTTRISHRCHDLQGQRSRSQGHVISLSRLDLILYLCH